jgi:O-antigen ligase
MFIVGGVYCSLVLLSTWYGFAVLGHKVIARDFYEIAKLWLPVVFFTVAYEARLSERGLGRLLGFFSAAVMLVCAYAWAQWLGLSIAHKLDPYYAGSIFIEGALLRYRRVYSTMGNPNLLGELMTWCVIAFTLAALHGIGSRVRNAAVALACLVTLAMCGSRFGLLTCAFGLLLAFALPTAFRRERLAQAGRVAGVLVVFAVAFAGVLASSDTIRQRFEALHRPLEVDSLRERVDILWRDAGAEISRSPLVGNGPAKSRYTGIITDSEYLDVLKQFGIIGFLAYLGYFLYPLSRCWRGVRDGQRAGPMAEGSMRATYWTVRLALIMTVTALVMNVGMVTLYNQILQGFLWMWMGLGVRAAQTLREAARLQFARRHEELHAVPAVAPEGAFAPLLLLDT